MGLRQALLELFAATRLRLQQAAEAEVRGERERCARTTQALTERCLGRRPLQVRPWLF